MSDICRLLAGKELRVTVHHETYNGKPSEKIDQLKGVHKTESLEGFTEIFSHDDIPF